MKTPQLWKDNIKNRIVTEEMLDAALYSVNKRAKNCRDQKRAYKGYMYHNNFDKYESKESEYYEKKVAILKHCKPLCIHREHLGYKRTRIFDYEKGFYNKLIDNIAKGRICWSNFYVNREYDDYYEFEESSEIVYFFDTINEKEEVVKHYLYFAIGEHTYHSPITEKKIEQFIDLPIIDINKIETQGHDTEDLCSVQFVNLLLDVLDDSDIMFESSNKISFKLIKSESTEVLKRKEDAYNYWENYIYDIVEQYVNAIYVVNTPINIEEISENEKLLITDGYRKFICEKLNKEKRREKKNLELLKEKAVKLSCIEGKSREKKRKKLLKSIDKIINKIYGCQEYQSAGKKFPNLDSFIWNFLVYQNHTGDTKVTVGRIGEEYICKNEAKIKELIKEDLIKKDFYKKNIGKLKEEIFRDLLYELKKLEETI